MSDEDLDDALSALGEHDVGAWRRENIRRRAHESLGGQRRSGLARAYHQVIEPALVATVCAIHLVWAFGAAASILMP
jgi:hypothetical protein